MDVFVPRAPSDYWTILRRRKLLFLIPFLGVLALAEAVSPFLPRTYEASVTMLLEEDSFINPAATREKDVDMRPKMDKQLRVLSTEVLSFPSLEKLIRNKDVGLGDEATSAPRVEVLAAQLKKHMTLKMPFDGVLVLTYESKTAHGAQRVINALARNLVEKNRQDQLARAQSSVEFTASELRVYKDRLQNSESSFFLNKVNAELEEARGRRDLLRDRLAEMKKTAPAQAVRELSPQVLEMRRELLRTESLLKQLEQDAKGDNPMIVGTREKIDALKKQLAFEEESRTGGDPGGENPEYRQVAQELQELEPRIKSLEQRRDDLAAGRVRPKNMTEQELLAVERDKKINEDVYQALRARLENAQISEQMNTLGHSRRLEIIDPARLPMDPTNPDPVKLWAVGAALALLIGAGAVAVRELADPSFRHGADAEEYLGAPPLAVLPPAPPGDGRPAADGTSSMLVVRHRPASPEAEGVRLLRTAVLSAGSGNLFKVLVVAGAARGDGASVLALNLAASLAGELSKKVLLLDADLAGGRAAELLGLPPGPGLSDYLSAAEGPAPEPSATKVDGLRVLPAGKPLEAPSRFFGLARMGELMAALKPRYDFIVVDAPPAFGAADVPVLLGHADAVLLVVRPGRTPRGAARGALAALDAAPGTRSLGYVLSAGRV